MEKIINKGTENYKSFHREMHRIAKSLTVFKRAFDDKLKEAGISLDMNTVRTLRTGFGWDQVKARVKQHVSTQPQSLQPVVLEHLLNELKDLRLHFRNIRLEPDSSAFSRLPQHLKNPFDSLELGPEGFKVTQVPESDFHVTVSAEAYADLIAFIKAQNKLYDRYGQAVETVMRGLYPEPKTQFSPPEKRSCKEAIERLAVKFPL